MSGLQLVTLAASEAAIADSGCARSMGNHLDQFRPGSIIEHESNVSGVAGAMKIKHQGHLA